MQYRSHMIHCIFLYLPHKTPNNVCIPSLKKSKTLANKTTDPTDRNKPIESFGWKVKANQGLVQGKCSFSNH